MRVDNGVVYTPKELALFAAMQLTEAEVALLGYPMRPVWDPCCGTGALLDACKQLDSGAKTYGSDIDSEAVVEAGMAGHTVACADLFDAQPPGDCTKLICNPPYVGRTNLSRIVGPDRFKWLKSTYKAERSGSCDLAGYVLRHVCQVWQPTVSTWIVTNTIAQGATRRVGLKWAVDNGYKIVACVKDVKWPGSAAVTINVLTMVHESKRKWPGKEVTYEPNGQQLFEAFCRTARP
jgi:predicted RNA methylase